LNLRSKKIFAAAPIVTPLSQIVVSLFITFGFFYLINYIFILVLYLKIIAKTEYSKLKVLAIMGVSSFVSFLALFVAFQFSSRMIFIFLITFVIIGLTNFLLYKNYLKIKKLIALILAVLLAIVANPAVWVWMIEWTKKKF
jgi:hypothetical protein